MPAGGRTAIRLEIGAAVGTVAQGVIVRVAVDLGTVIAHKLPTYTG